MGSSIEAVLSEAARRRDKTVGWLNPDWPLLPTTNGSSRLMLEMPLSVDGMTSTVTRAGRLAGIIGHINTTTCLLSVPGVATASPTMAAAHTFQSMAVFRRPTAPSRVCRGRLEPGVRVPPLTEDGGSSSTDLTKALESIN